jgi:hypothetical protein
MSDRTPLRITVGGLGLAAMLTVPALAGGHPAAASDVAHGAQVRSWVTVWPPGSYSPRGPRSGGCPARRRPARPSSWTRPGATKR